MVAMPTVMLYKSMKTYPHMWTDLHTHKQEYFVAGEIRHQLVPRRQVKTLTQLQIQQVLSDIREVKDKVGMDPEIINKFLLDGKNKKRKKGKAATSIVYLTEVDM